MNCTTRPLPPILNTINWKPQKPYQPIPLPSSVLPQVRPPVRETPFTLVDGYSKRRKNIA